MLTTTHPIDSFGNSDKDFTNLTHSNCSESTPGMKRNRKQDLFLDGIEETFFFIRHTYTRLTQAIRNSNPNEKDTKVNDVVLLDCWTIIDHAKRLRSLLDNTPGLKKTPNLKVFMNKTNSIPDFRDHIQHLEEKAKDIAPTNFSIWGSVSYARLLPDRKCIISVYLPGRIAEAKGVPAVNPVGREIHGDIDHIELSVENRTINISELVRQIEILSESFDSAVSNAEKDSTRDQKGILRFTLSELPDSDF